jgi:hypothetical protein
VGTDRLTFRHAWPAQIPARMISFFWPCVGRMINGSK